MPSVHAAKQTTGHLTHRAMCTCVYLQAGVALCEWDLWGGQAHWRPHEEGFVVIDVFQGHLQWLHGLVWHRLAQVTGHQDELWVEQHSQKRMWVEVGTVT